MFKTKIFNEREIIEGGLDRWLNSLSTPGYGVKIASQVALVKEVPLMQSISTTVSVWKLQEANGLSVRPTIDEIPQEPSINYPEDEVPNIDLR